MKSVLSLVLMVIYVGSSIGDPNTKYPVGDVRNCLSDVTSDVVQFEVLPGSGWDNLRNIQAGMVLAINYSQCRLTEDRRFLIPDYINVYPVKTSRVDAFAEIINSWKDYVSATSKSINVDAGFKSIFDVSGTFSAEYSDMKKKQIEDNSLTTRVQARYVRYRAILQPDMPLDPAFKYRLLSIAGALELGDARQARFESQQLVREFGTHVSTGVDAGAAILQEEQVSSNLLETSSATKANLKVAAGFSFTLNVGNFFAGASASSAEQQTFNSLYLANRTDSKVRSLGGNLITKTNITIEEWVKDIDNDLVAIDRSGEPIFNFINAQTIPEIPASTLLQLTEMVQEAVMSYYKINTHAGCTDPVAPNYSPRSNVDDGSCKPPPTNMNFGGVYQVCNTTSSDAGDLCKELSQTNPATGSYSCPTGYEAVSLYSSQKTKQKVNHVCGSCWLVFGHCCHDEVKSSSSSYETFWCVAVDQELQDSGYMFGGVYTSHVENPVTSSMTCPHTFIPLKMGEDIRVCVSDDYLQAVSFSIPFAGFFSCVSGNPLALGSNTHKNSSLWAHMYTQGPQQWPRRCPHGYSRYTTEIMPVDGCEVNHCIQAGALSDVKLPAIRRPPFVHPPVQTPYAKNIFVFDPEQKVWVKNEGVSLKYPNFTPSIQPTIQSPVSEMVYEFEFYSAEGRKHHGKNRHSRGSKEEASTWKTTTIISEVAMLAVIAVLTVVIFCLVVVMKKMSSQIQSHRPLGQGKYIAGYDNNALKDVVSSYGEKRP